MRRIAYALAALAGIALFAAVQASRDVPAVGGEALLLALPLWLLIAELVVSDVVNGGWR